MPKIIDDEKVFNATIEILMKHGYENATTKAISAEAHINEATLFRKYGSKFDLIDRAIQHYLSDTPLHKLKYTGVLEADLQSIVQAYIEVSKSRGDIIFVLFFEVARDSSLQKFMETPMKNIQIILDIFAAYQAQGLLKQESPLMTLASLIGPIMINNLTKRASINLALPAIDIQQHVESFLYGRRSNS